MTNTRYVLYDAKLDAVFETRIYRDKAKAEAKLAKMVWHNRDRFELREVCLLPVADAHATRPSEHDDGGEAGESEDLVERARVAGGDQGGTDPSTRVLSPAPTEAGKSITEIASPPIAALMPPTFAELCEDLAAAAYRAWEEVRDKNSLRGAPRGTEPPK